jgi:hypothetical protein
MGWQGQEPITQWVLEILRRRDPQSTFQGSGPASLHQRTLGCPFEISGKLPEIIGIHLSALVVQVPRPAKTALMLVLLTLIRTTSAPSDSTWLGVESCGRGSEVKRRCSYLSKFVLCPVVAGRRSASIGQNAMALMFKFIRTGQVLTRLALTHAPPSVGMTPFAGR